MTRRTRITTLLLVPAALLAAALVAVALIRPSNDRNWIPEHSRPARASIEGDRVWIENIRDFRTVSPDSVQQGYYDRAFDLDGIESLWLMLSVFHEEDFRGPAHSALSFGFSDGSYLVVSVEARKEIGEQYSIYRGMLKQYELTYVIGDERDLIRTRAVFRPDDVYLYRIRASKEKLRELFVEVLQGANELQDHPRHYNTLYRNCTTVLRDHVNKVAPGRIPRSWKLLFPGYADELLDNLDLLDTGHGVRDARRRAWVNERAREAADSADFSARIRALP